MLTDADIAHAMATPPPAVLDPATIRRLVAARPESTVGERIASAAYLDGLAAQEAAGMPSSVRAGRLLAFAEERRAILADLEGVEATRA